MVCIEHGDVWSMCSFGPIVRPPGRTSFAFLATQLAPEPQLTAACHVGSFLAVLSVKCKGNPGLHHPRLELRVSQLSLNPALVRQSAPNNSLGWFICGRHYTCGWLSSTPKPKPKLRRVICLIYHPCFGILRGWQFGRCPLVVHGVSTGLTWIRRLFFLFFISKQAASAQGIPCGTGSLVAVAPSESLREPCVGSLEIPGAFEPCCIRTTCAARCTRWLVGRALCWVQDLQQVGELAHPTLGPAKLAAQMLGYKWGYMKLPLG